MMGRREGFYCLSRSDQAQNHSILLCGLPKSGKTSILYRLKLNDFIVTSPTWGPNKEVVSLDFFDGPSRNVVFFDIGQEVCKGSTKKKKVYLCDPADEQTKSLLHPKRVDPLAPTALPSWTETYAEQSDGAVYVIDVSCSRRTLLDCRCDIEFLLYQENFYLKQSKLLILLNKSDLGVTLEPDFLSDLLSLPMALYGTRWMIEACSAKNGDGLQKAFKWLLSGTTPSMSSQLFGMSIPQLEQLGLSPLIVP